MKKTTALIVAGGKGTRFHPYTELIPKPMIPLGKEERPVLEFIVRWLVRNDIKDIVMLVNHRWKYVRNYFGDGARFGANISYSIDEPDGYTNTGGAVYKAFMEGFVNERAIVWYGDILASLDVGKLLSFHQDKGSEITLVVSNKYSVPVGVAELEEDGKVRKMVEKPELSINATIGIVVLEQSVFEKELLSELGKNFDLMGELVPAAIQHGKRVYGYKFDGEWYDVGSLERYKKIDPEHLERMFE
ncbi:MAG: nucleotidyltransferase family protein [Fervidicoccaceae archaeon]